MTSVCLVVQGEDGHKSDYTRLFMEALPLIGREVSKCSGSRCLSSRSDCLFLQMIEGNYPLFFLSSVLGLLDGHRTVGLLFRPKEAIKRGTFRHLLKYAFFRIFSRLPNTRVLTIIPFGIDPQFSKIATGWIYDPQLWDLTFAGFNSTYDDTIAGKARDAASGRRVIVALGVQNHGKGFDYLTNIWCKSDEIRSTHLFIVAGRVAAESKNIAAAFEAAGGLLFDRQLTDSELMGLYGSADAIWGCYAPTYDQASGIFGRAFQLGIPVIVRAGSYISRLASSLDHQTIELEFDNPSQSARMLIRSVAAGSFSREIRPDVWKLRRKSLAILNDAVGNDVRS